MSRAVIAAFFITCFMLSLSLLHTTNLCYEYGNLINGCPDEAGVGHPFLPFEIHPVSDYVFHDANNNIVNASDQESVKAAYQDAVKYNPAPSGITDIYGFFSWVITGGRLIINTFFMPLVGFPELLTMFYIPAFITYPIATLIMIINLVGLYEFFTGRDIFRR